MSNIIKFGVFFDGTGNHKDMDKAEGKGTQTNIAKLYNLFKASNGEDNSIYRREDVIYKTGCNRCTSILRFRNTHT